MAFIDSHNPWALAFGIMGNFISLVVYFAPFPTFLRIYRRKSTEGFQSLPYLVALFSAMLWLYYAFIKTNAFLLITINSFGCVIELIYIGIYMFYATKESKRCAIWLIVCINLVLFGSIIIVTQFLVHEPQKIKVLGWICVVISVAVFAAPLSIVVQVIRTRSVEFMPFTLSMCLTLSAIFWFAYGFFQKDICVAIPNIMGFVLGMLQMGLYAMYRRSEEETDRKEEQSKNIAMVMSNLRNCEVYPENEENEEVKKMQESPV